MKSEDAQDTTVIDNKAVGQRIREERERLALTRAELAELIGLSDYYIGQLERGERQMSLPTLIKIASCLHVSMDYLILGSSKYKDHSTKDNTSLLYANENTKVEEIYSLIGKCSSEEFDLIKKLIQTVLPYI